MQRPHPFGSPDFFPIHIVVLGTSVALTCHATAALANAGSPNSPGVGETCAIDLKAIPEYLERNDAGVHDEAKSTKVKNAATKFSEAVQTIDSLDSDAECTQLIRSLLSHYRSGHLGISDLPQVAKESQAVSAQVVPAIDPMAPRIELLSNRTALIVIPSFDGAYQSHVERLMQRYASALKKRSRWIVDVRGNTGGSDWAWKPLFARFNPSLFQVVDVEFLATPENIAANNYLKDLGLLPSVEAQQLIESINASMQHSGAGQFIVPGNQTSTQRVSLVALPAGSSSVRMVAILADRSCASSCEQFLMESRQSWRVKTFGQRTAGVLDYSNLRPWLLPSGRRILWYATSRSRRLPDNGIDGFGLGPDYPLPKPTDDSDRRDEIRTVRKIIEATR